MKLILAAEGVKREINGPFEICASYADVQRLHSILTELLRTDDGRRGFHYGWFRVDDPIDSPSNSPPRPWSE